MSSLQTVWVLLPLLLPGGAAACWGDVAQRFGLPVALLHAVAKVESNLDPRAINRSHEPRTGTYDIGLMQINSFHLRSLQPYGINEAALLDPCTNLQIGAWLLADAIARHGMTWNAVGAYNASCIHLKGEACVRARATYAWKVYRQLQAVDRPPKPSEPSAYPAMSTRPTSLAGRRAAAQEHGEALTPSSDHLSHPALALALKPSDSLSSELSHRSKPTQRRVVQELTH